MAKLKAHYKVDHKVGMVSIKPGHTYDLLGGKKREDLQIVGQLIGNRIAKKDYLTTDLFDSLSILRYSDNPINKHKFIHVIGFMNRTNSYSILVCKLKNESN